MLLSCAFMWLHLITCLRKYRNGSITTILALSVSTSTLHASGLQEMPFTTWTVMRWWRKQGMFLEQNRDIRPSWVPFRMQQQLFGMLWLQRIGMTMLKLPWNGHRLIHQSIFKPGEPYYVLASSLSLIPFFVSSLYRMASSMRKRVIQDFQRQLHKTCGVRTLVLTAHEGEDKKLKVSL